MTNEKVDNEVCDHEEVLRDYQPWDYDYCPACLEKL